MTDPESGEDRPGPARTGVGGSRAERRQPSALNLRLPATSANLGPGFDSLGLAMSLFLTIRARCAPSFSIEASGRDAAVTGAAENNLIRTTYEEILLAAGQRIAPLALMVENEIPLGMGCGSSAAALCAGVMLANHFGELRWGPEQILHEAARREGHPDNVAACLLGGLTTSKTIAPDPESGREGHTVALTLGAELGWRLLLALPHASLSTAAARRLLPETYSRRDAVNNVQSTALLVGAFALNRPDLLRMATEDRLHQPYRMEACPLLAALLPLAGKDGVQSVTLSGAGPSVLLIVEDGVAVNTIRQVGGALVAEVLEVSIAGEASSISVID